MKWKAPRDNGGKPITGFVIERRAAGKKSWTRTGEVDSSATTFTDDQVDEGQMYQYRIRAVNEAGMSEPLETEEVRAGEPVGETLGYIFMFTSPSRIKKSRWEKEGQGIFRG